MRDNVYLLVHKMRIDNVISYALDADIYTADDMFSIEIKKPEVKIPKGVLCELYVNDKLELTGICDHTAKRYSKKEGVKLVLEGRDLCGLLTDSHCEEFMTVQGMDLKALAERLLKNVPFINKKAIVYQTDVRGNLKKKKGKGAGRGGKVLAGLGGGATAGHAYAQIEPGQTIAEVLKIYCQSRGIMFWTMPDGTLMFGRPKEGGQPLYHLVTRHSNPSENNIINGVEDENLSKSYSKVTVMGQQQGTNTVNLDGGPSGGASWNTKATVPNPMFPFYKPLVVTDNNDSRSPKLHADMLIAKMKYEGYQIHYTVKGHSQYGTNWAINEMVHVTDEIFELDSDFLIYGRTFRRSKKEGVVTTLRLGYPGLVVQ